MNLTSGLHSTLACNRPPPPLSGSLDGAVDCARSIGSRLASDGRGLPVYYYGAAHERGHRLADIRRSLGEIGRRQEGNVVKEKWEGASTHLLVDVLVV